MSKKKTRFNFGSIVVVERNLIGVVVKCWGSSSRTSKYSYDVYVRSLNGIVSYDEEDIGMFIYDKELSDENMEYQE